MIMINNKEYRELRCFHCRNFIVYENVIGEIAYRCPKCGYLNEFQLKALKTKSNLDKINKFLLPTKGGENK